MLYRLFNLILFLSLAGGGAALLLFLACRMAGGALSFRWRYRLWLLPVLLLLAPVVLSLPVHTAPTTGASPTAIPDTVSLQPEAAPPQAGQLASTEGQSTPKDTLPNPQPTAPAADASPTLPHLTLKYKQLVPLIWLGGVLVLTVRYAAAQLRFRRFRRRATVSVLPWERELLDTLQISLGLRRPVALCRFSGTGSPFLSGILRPVIYLPQSPLPPEALRQVLTHELVHCKRRDLPLKRLVCAVKVVHWFNPMVWLAERELDRLCELSCDEVVTARWDKEARRTYGMTILALMRAPARHIPGAACLAEREIKNRLEVIMNTKHHSLPRRVLSALLVAVLCLGCTALAAGVNGSNPAKGRAGIYRTDDFYYITYLSKSPAVTSTDPYADDAFAPGSGYTYSATGSATLTDTFLKKSFSATLKADAIFPQSLNVYPADLSSAVYEVELVSLTRVIESRGEWAGLFTVKRDGVVIFEKEPGRLTHIPSLDGTQLTELVIGRDGQKFFYALINFGLDGLSPVSGYAADTRQTRALLDHPDTHEITTKQSQPATIAGYATEPYFYNDIYVNDTLKQVSLELTLDPKDLNTPRYGRAPSAFLSIELRPQDVTYYGGDTVKGRFYLSLPNFQDLEFDGTLTGLNGSPGALITLRSDDGAYQLSSAIQTDRRGAELNPSTPNSDRYEGLSESQKADMAFHDTGESTQREDVGATELPFEVALTRDAVTLRYTGTLGYKTGAQLRYTVLTDAGIRYRNVEQLVGSTPVTIPLPKDSTKTFDLDLYQVSVEKGAEMNRYTYYIIQGASRSVAYEMWYYSFWNPGYRGDAAIAQITGRDGGGVMAPAFLFGTP